MVRFAALAEALGRLLRRWFAALRERRVGSDLSHCRRLAPWPTRESNPLRASVKTVSGHEGCL